MISKNFRTQIYNFNSHGLKSLMQNVITCLRYKNGPENGYYLLMALPKMITYLGWQQISDNHTYTYDVFFISCKYLFRVLLASPWSLLIPPFQLGQPPGIIHMAELIHGRDSRPRQPVSKIFFFLGQRQLKPPCHKHSIHKIFHGMDLCKIGQNQETPLL